MSLIDQQSAPETEKLTPPDLPDFISNPTLLGLDDKILLLAKRNITVLDGSVIGMRMEKGRKIVYRGGNPWRIYLLGPQLYFKFDGWTIYRQTDASFVMTKNGQRFYVMCPAHGNKDTGTHGPDSHFIENIFTEEDWRTLKHRYGETKLLAFWKKVTEGKISLEKKPNPFLSPSINQDAPPIWAAPQNISINQPAIPANDVLPKEDTEKLVTKNDSEPIIVEPVSPVKITNARKGFRKMLLAAAMLAGTAIAGLGIRGAVQDSEDQGRAPAAAQLRTGKTLSGKADTKVGIDDSSISQPSSAEKSATAEPANATRDFAANSVNPQNLNRLSQKKYSLPDRAKLYASQHADLNDIANGAVKVTGKKGVLAEIISTLIRYADTPKKRQALQKLVAEINAGSGTDARLQYAGLGQKEKSELNQKQHREIAEKYGKNGITELETLSKTITDFNQLQKVASPELEKDAHKVALYRNLRHQLDTPNIHNSPVGTQYKINETAFTYLAFNILFPELFQETQPEKVPTTVTEPAAYETPSPLEFGKMEIEKREMQKDLPKATKTESKVEIALNPQPDIPNDPMDISAYRKKLHDRYMADLDAGWDT